MAESGEGLWMSAKELDRLKVYTKLRNDTSQKQAAAELGLSVRWVRKLLLRLRAAGDAGLRHGLRGRPACRERNSSFGSGCLKSPIGLWLFRVCPPQAALRTAETEW